MQLNVTHPVLCLQSGQVLSLDDAAGTRISMRSGAAWVTEEGEARDVILATGEALVVGRDGRTVVQALQPSWVAIR